MTVMAEQEVLVGCSWWGGGENRRKSESEITQSAGLCDPMDYTLHGILQAGILQWADFLFCRGSSQAGMELRSPALRADSLPAEPQGRRWSLIVDGAWGAVLSPQEGRPRFSVTFPLL